ncbi:helix-turn-helix domain-containing protein [Epilithonimonas arachidiradicis]|uniref:DNA-binding XRE family transcriptional regulator n=1 Tax=Epilithonimonas arachidiradicis TaxID=1617282 RepID=A0A420D954_9FLAO|nr:helix-turn-helix transcriptional regulator [Epilithonimonas arachidiradicis]RKE87263.1 DNA-binding XRE family transcriptional regulator [Epilithonimonas arachidiradicis]GGG59561.1 hypothetical protein GCM10007332_21560 [Epilithonimonas arachidiradicis]
MELCGKNIRKIRRDRDLTQEYMAFEMGISQKAYSDIENSKVKINLEILNKISAILSIKPSEVCSIADQCGDGVYKTKYEELIGYLNKHNINIPSEL